MKPTDVTKGKAAQAKFSLDDMQGKWQEARREDLGKEAIPFTDTLLLQINGTQSVHSQGNTMTMRGPAAIDGAYLSLPTGDYEIKKLSAKELVLFDGETTTTLSKVSHFYKESLGKDSVKTETLATDNIQAESIIGDWNIYRRSAEAGSIPADHKMLKRMIITETADKKLTGRIEYGQENNGYNEEATFTIQGNTLLVVTDKTNLKLLNYKAQNGEFIFADEAGMIYYSKK